MIQFKINRGSLRVVAPENGKEEKSDLFHSDLQKQLDMYDNTDNIVIAGHLNMVTKLFNLLLVFLQSRLLPEMA